MGYIFLLINVFATPVLAIIFCLNLVAIIKKARRDEPTERSGRLCSVKDKSCFISMKGYDWKMTGTVVMEDTST